MFKEIKDNQTTNWRKIETKDKRKKNMNQMKALEDEISPAIVHLLVLFRLFRFNHIYLSHYNSYSSSNEKRGWHLKGN